MTVCPSARTCLAVRGCRALAARFAERSHPAAESPMMGEQPDPAFPAVGASLAVLNSASGPTRLSGHAQAAHIGTLHVRLGPRRSRPRSHRRHETRAEQAGAETQVAGLQPGSSKAIQCRRRVASRRLKAMGRSGRQRRRADRAERHRCSTPHCPRMSSRRAHAHDGASWRRAKDGTADRHAAALAASVQSVSSQCTQWAPVTRRRRAASGETRDSESRPELASPRSRRYRSHGRQHGS